MRGTFMSIGQSLLVRRQLEIEKTLKEKMIHSVMPPKVADWLMKETAAEENDDVTHYREDGAILRPVSVSIFFSFCKPGTDKNDPLILGLERMIYKCIMCFIGYEMTLFQSVLQVSSPRPSHTSGLDSMFRPFNMHGMDNVSILFADIVGFTRMSSNKVHNEFQLLSSTFNVLKYCKM